MKMEHLEIEVTPDKPSLLHLEGKIITSVKSGGCGLPGCGCSPGHWISVAEPVNEDSILKITKFRFDSREELEEFIDSDIKVK